MLISFCCYYYKVMFLSSSNFFLGLVFYSLYASFFEYKSLNMLSPFLIRMGDA